jgi:hypothetical protein
MVLLLVRVSPQFWVDFNPKARDRGSKTAPQVEQIATFVEPHPSRKERGHDGTRGWKVGGKIQTLDC